MRFLWAHRLHVPVCLSVLVFLIAPFRISAQTHVVNPDDLHKDVAAASKAREANIEEVQKFLASPAAREEMKSAHFNEAQVQKAVRELTADEAAEFAARAEKAQQDFSAGALTHTQLMYIIIALATALIVLLLATR